MPLFRVPKVVVTVHLLVLFMILSPWACRILLLRKKSLTTAVNGRNLLRNASGEYWTLAVQLLTGPAHQHSGILLALVSSRPVQPELVDS